MGVEWTRSMAFLREAAGRLRLRREREPIETADQLAAFVSTRSAFVAQKKLYGYLKARMGTRYPSMFEDDVFIQSINVAKLHVFAACLSDLAVHTAARVGHAGSLGNEQAALLASHCFEWGIGDNEAHLPDQDMAQSWRDGFATRLRNIHWENLTAGGDAFSESPKALFQWAPIAENLKRYDQEIVENSIRFAFGEVARDFRERATPGGIATDWRRSRMDAEAPAQS